MLILSSLNDQKESTCMMMKQFCRIQAENFRITCSKRACLLVLIILTYHFVEQSCTKRIDGVRVRFFHFFEIT